MMATCLVMLCLAWSILLVAHHTNAAKPVILPTILTSTPSIFTGESTSLLIQWSNIPSTPWNGNVPLGASLDAIQKQCCVQATFPLNGTFTHTNDIVAIYATNEPTLQPWTLMPIEFIYPALMDPAGFALGRGSYL